MVLGNIAECDDRMTRKRHTTSKQETAAPKKRSKENVSLLME